MDPDYQREGGIWNLEKKRLLIDTIINRFDVPKLYVHKFAIPRVIAQQSVEFAVIDGKQRLRTMWEFIQGGFALDTEFKYQISPEIDLSSMKYQDLAKHFPDIKSDFDAFPLHVITIEAEDLEVIEDLFSRLNEAVPLNAAEKRNAKPGPVPELIRELSSHEFFTKKLPFGNNRYRHYDIASKFLLIASRDRIPDLKKAYIDKFFDSQRNNSRDSLKGPMDSATATLDALVQIFEDKDSLVRTVGMLTLYYVLFGILIKENIPIKLTRKDFLDFEATRSKNKEIAEEDISNAAYELMEFDRFTQSPNDAIAIRYRMGVFDKYLFQGKLGLAEEIFSLEDGNQI
jgi:hypothetical protein